MTWLLRATIVSLVHMVACLGALEVFAASDGSRVAIPITGSPFYAKPTIAQDGAVVFSAVSPTADQGGPAKLALDELVRWGHPVSPLPHTLVALRDGGRVVTLPDWAGGAAVRVANDTVTIRSETLGEVPLTRKDVRGIVFAHRQPVEERERLLSKLDEPPALRDARADVTADTISLTNGDLLEGRLTSLGRGSLTMVVREAEVNFPLSRVEFVRFASNGQPDSPLSERQLALAMRDGSLLYVDRVFATDDGAIQLATQGRADMTILALEDIVGLQNLNDRFVYLSDLTPTSYRHIPYLNIEWPYRADRSVTGGTLLVNGQRYLKGIGIHSASRLTYSLDRQFARFDASIAMDDSAGSAGSVTFSVYLLRGGTWQEAYKSDIMRGGSPPLPISVDVASAQGITLIVDYADRGDELDRANWLDARLVRK